MYVIRSTHSLRLSDFPSKSMRSPCRTSTFVKGDADIVSLFIAYQPDLEHRPREAAALKTSD